MCFGIRDAVCVQLPNSYLTSLASVFSTYCNAIPFAVMWGFNELMNMTFLEHCLAQSALCAWSTTAFLTHQFLSLVLREPSREVTPMLGQSFNWEGAHTGAGQRVAELGKKLRENRSESLG